MGGAGVDTKVKEVRKTSAWTCESMESILRILHE